MDELFTTLCEIFDDELERQRNVLDVCLAQGAAARARDVQHLEVKTAALAILIQEAVEAEAHRMDIVQRVVERYRLPVEEQTLSGLIAVAPEPWKSRMRDFQKEIRRVLESVKKVVRENEAIIRQSIDHVNQAVNTFAECVENPRQGYDARGGMRSIATMQPAMIDRQG